MHSRAPSRCVARLLAVGLAGVAFSAGAVVQNVAVVNSAGEPVANSTVTIVFPDGTEKEEKTDRKGILIFDFPNDGNYHIRFTGGQMAYTVTGAGEAAERGWGTTEWVALGTVVAAGTVAALSAGGGDGGSDSSYEPPTGGGTGGTVAGTYNCTFTQTSNADNHPTGSLNGAYSVAENGSNLNLSHSSGSTSLNASGPLNGMATNYSGNGTFQGFNGAQWSGTLNFAQTGASGSTTVNCQACPDSNANGTHDAVQGTLNCTKS